MYSTEIHVIMCISNCHGSWLMRVQEYSYTFFKLPNFFSSPSFSPFSSLFAFFDAPLSLNTILQTKQEKMEFLILEFSENQGMELAGLKIDEFKFPVIQSLHFQLLQIFLGFPGPARFNGVMMIKMAACDHRQAQLQMRIWFYWLTQQYASKHG